MLLNLPAPIRSRANEEAGIEIPLWGVPVILGVLYFCLFNGLGVIGMVGPDEPRYAAIARAMAANHDWVTPRLWGSPWFEKPVLYYWTGAIAMRVFGIGEFAARLPSALAALFAVLAAAWAALRSYGLGAAYCTLFMLPASVAMIAFARGAGPDMLFAGLLTGAMAIALDMLEAQRTGPIPKILFGFFLGAAVLAKGPAAVILAGGSALAWAVFSRQWRAAFQFFHPLILAVFCATALPWYVLCAARNPDFLRVFIWQHNFERYLTPIFEHPQPFWFYGMILILAALPWTIFAGLPLGRWAERRWRDSPGLFIACWALFPVLFFSASQSKLPGYILPAIPPLFVLVGRAMALSFERATSAGRALLTVTGAGMIIATLILGAGFLRVDAYGLSSRSEAMFLVLLAAGGALAGILAIRRRARAALVAISVTITALVAFANVTIMPSLDAHISPRMVADAYFERQSLPANSPGYGPGKAGVPDNAAFYQLNRNWSYGLDYYFDRELPEWRPGMPRPEWLFTTAKGEAELQRLGISMEEAASASAPNAVLLHNPEAH